MAPGTKIKKPQDNNGTKTKKPQDNMAPRQKATRQDDTKTIWHQDKMAPRQDKMAPRLDGIKIFVFRLCCSLSLES
jgi:hypothetical protein